ncbi:RNaseH domain-containing protein [Actinopolyspora erythraea]|uniref:RNaseH domain-containing protein n=1 Tax=Actinopolyspora erythraea TaxID=414996 RepID=UPI0011857061|nr:RNaseH domain-containing protein [Actinopolyspora erythraea]
MWEFDDEVGRAWQNLRTSARKSSFLKKTEGDGGADIPYSIATTVLTQLTGGYVHLDRQMRFLVALSRTPEDAIPAKTLRRVFTSLEGVVSGKDLDEIPFTVNSDLAHRIANTTPHRRCLAETVLPSADTPVDPPNWAYESVRWHIADKLAAVPLYDKPVASSTKPSVNNKGESIDRITGWHTNEDKSTWVAVSYRPTSSGELVAWDHPINTLLVSRGHPIAAHEVTRDWPSDPEQAQYGMSRLSIRMKTFPNLPWPVITITPHMRRVNSTVCHARTALLNQGNTTPLVQVELTKRGGARRLSAHALRILAKLTATPSALHAVEDRVDAEIAQRKQGLKRWEISTPPPGTVRPTVPKSEEFAVGTGMGRYHNLLVRDMINRAFSDRQIQFMELESAASSSLFAPRAAKQLTEDDLETKKSNEQGRYADQVGLPNAEAIRGSLEAEGNHTLRLVCLWCTPVVRQRMWRGLACSYGIDPEVGEPAENEPFSLAPGVEAVFCEASGVLAHGVAWSERQTLMRKLLTEHLAAGRLVAAWCETEVKPTNPADDGKHACRKILNSLTIPSQFLRARDDRDEIIQPPEIPHRDYRVFMGLLDLYRSCGIVDDRFERALYSSKLTCPLSQRLAWVGIHVRRQGVNKETRKKKFWSAPKRIVCLVALVPPPHPEGVWRLLGWSNLDPAWKPYRDAVTAFGTTSYPLHASTEQDDRQRWRQVAGEVNTALAELARHELDGRDYAVLLDGEKCRRIWPGLHNNKQDVGPEQVNTTDAWLPGPDGLKPVSTVRINVADEEMPQVTEATDTAKNGTTKTVAMPHGIYRPVDRLGSDHPWFVNTVPRNYGKTRYGQWYTRWRAEQQSSLSGKKVPKVMEAPWYALSTREIMPIRTQQGYDRAEIAFATARLCHESLSWTDITNYPTPLHLAKKMDEDHPEYRRSCLDALDEELAEEIEQSN